MRLVLALLISLCFFGITQFVSACSELLDHEIRLLDSDEKLNLCELTGKSILVVNVASRCGYTNQYTELQRLYETYSEKGFIVLGVPSRDFYQEFRDDSKVSEFCSTEYGVTFPMLTTSKVKGFKALPFFKKLAKASGMEPNWNFNKYLISKDGLSVEGFRSKVKPSSEELTYKITTDLNS